MAPRIALAQLDLTVGDLVGNAERIGRAYEQAVAEGAALVAFPELAVTGYPPEDLLLKRAFVGAAREALEKVATPVGEAVAVIGFPEPGGEGRPFNAAAVCRRGRVEAVYRKQLLPNYSVFDEERYFEPGRELQLVEAGGARVGISICEDIWDAEGPPTREAALGARLVVNINASPYHQGRQREREAMLVERASETGCALAYVNCVGGQDELIFDGGSVVVGPDGAVLARARQFLPDLLVVDLDPAPEAAPGGAGGPPVEGGAARRASPTAPRPEAPRPEAPATAGAAAAAVEPLLDAPAEVYEALVTGTRDYVAKNGFSGVLVGLSGGIDSSMVAAIAADALGPERVAAVIMPSRFSSEGSVTDARELSANLGIEVLTVPIEPAHGAFELMLRGTDDEPGPFAGTEPGVAEENTQARIRGTVLMALSNKFGWLVLTTGNKSEMAVGYATLYGDMAGGYAVIKDVWKTQLYDLARWRNAHGPRPPIPEHVLTKPPSAELREDQRDTDALAPYEELDPVLEAYVEHRRPVAEMERRFPPELVRQVVRLVDRNEYKRRQAPPGPRVTSLAFGKDRRLPITNRWSG